MRARTLFLGLALLGAAGVCLRLSAWQAGRWRQAQARTSAERAAFSGTPVRFEHGQGVEAGRRVIARGVYDSTRFVLLAARLREGEPGVHVVSPLRLTAGGTVLVDRGFMAADDSRDAHPERFHERGEVSVTARAESLVAPGEAEAWSGLEPVSGIERWSAWQLDPDTVRARLPDARVPWLLVALPDSALASRAAPGAPRRESPEFDDGGTHLSYAIQWLLFAIVFVAGAVFVWTRDRSRTAGA